MIRDEATILAGAVGANGAALLAKLVPALDMMIKGNSHRHFQGRGAQAFACLDYASPA